MRFGHKLDEPRVLACLRESPQPLGKLADHQACGDVGAEDSALGRAGPLVGLGRGECEADEGPGRADSLQANQDELNEAIDSITRISDYTQFGTKKLLNGDLASGKPVISTPLPEVIVYRDVVAIAGTAEEFECAAERLLQEQDGQEAHRRMEYVHGDSWDAVASRFVKVLEG